jgi:hypothetical protein
MKQKIEVEIDFAIGNRVELFNFGLYGTITAFYLDGTQVKYIVRGHGIDYLPYFAEELKPISKP